MKGSFLDIAGRWESTTSVNRSVSFIRVLLLHSACSQASFIPEGPFSSIVQVFWRVCVCAECVSKATFVGSRQLGFWICNTMQFGGSVSGKTEEGYMRFESVGGLGIVAWLSKCLFWVCVRLRRGPIDTNVCLRLWRSAGLSICVVAYDWDEEWAMKSEVSQQTTYSAVLWHTDKSQDGV